MEGDVPVIAVDALGKEFRSFRRRVRALESVTLRVARGEVFGLLGANGAGKTTLIKILLGLANPSSGTARLRGLDPRRPVARRRVGYLPEGHRFPDYLSGRATLRLFGRLAGVGEGVLDARIPQLLDLVGLADRGGDRVGRYSKGMTQRLGLACALIDEPEILFLDEPTDGVDPVGRRHIREVLLAWRAQGATIFINSHLLSEVERTCDRVAILDHGRVAREGRVDELTRTGLRYRITLDGAAIVDPKTLQAPGTSVASVDGHIEVEASDVTALNVLIDQLRAARHLVTEVSPLRSDLEDVFVELLHPTGAAPEVPEAGRPR